MVEPIEPMEIDDEFVEMFCKPDLDFESKIVEVNWRNSLLTSRVKKQNNTNFCLLLLDSVEQTFKDKRCQQYKKWYYNWKQQLWRCK